jgi:hypothetical protein
MTALIRDNIGEIGGCTRSRRDVGEIEGRVGFARQGYSGEATENDRDLTSLTRTPLAGILGTLVPVRGWCPMKESL